MSMLFIKTEKSRGPKTDHWGIPDEETIHNDKQLPIFTCWVHQVRQLSNQFSIEWDIP